MELPSNRLTICCINSERSCNRSQARCSSNPGWSASLEAFHGALVFEKRQVITDLQELLASYSKIRQF